MRSSRTSGPGLFEGEDHSYLRFCKSILVGIIQEEYFLQHGQALVRLLARARQLRLPPLRFGSHGALGSGPRLQSAVSGSMTVPGGSSKLASAFRSRSGCRVGTAHRSWWYPGEE
jgi:hypothetical protein